MKPKLPPDANDRLNSNCGANLKDRVLLSPITKYVLPTFLVASSLLAGVYVTMLLLTINENDFIGTCEVPSIYQVNCLPGQETTYEKCTGIGCCYDETTQRCYHTMPSRYGYMKDAKDPNVLRPKESISPLGSENKPVTVHVNRIDAEYIQIKLITHEQVQQVYQFETEIVKLPENLQDYIPKNAMKSIQVEPDSDSNPKSLFSLTFTRDNEMVLTTARGPLIITETYWEWSLFLGNSSVYGLNSLSLNGTFNWLYNNEDSIVIPGFLGITNNGMGIGCYIECKGPMEIEVLQSNLIILRGMSMPETLSIHIFTGETAQDVTNKFFNLSKKQQAAELTLSNLGLHMCPEKEQDMSTTLENLNSIIENMESRGVPWDSHCIHREFYPTLDRVLDQDEQEILTEVQKVLSQKGKTVLHHVSNVCSYGKSNLAFELAKLSLLLENIHGPYIGANGNESVAYPNWMDDQTLTVYDTEIKRYLQASPMSKSLYLRDLWPRDDSNFTTDFSRFDYIPKQLQALMSRGSVPIGLFSSTAESHYKVHNDYARAFQTFVETYAHSMQVELWNEGVTSGWVGLKKILNRGIATGLLGQLPSAIYMCSATAPADDDLCQRWYGIGVVFPHILAVPQNIPGGDWLSIGTSKYVSKLLRLRASLITYQHSTITEYYNSGAPILAPMYFHYPNDVYMKYIENQFMWGASILVGVVTLPKTVQVQMHIPGKLSWRHLQGGLEVKPTSGKSISLSVLEGEIITLLRPGHIIPFHETPGLTSMNTRRSPLKLICNLAYIEGKYEAEGRIFFDGGAFLNIAVDDTSLKLKSSSNADSEGCSSQTRVQISSLEILGHQSTYQIDLDVPFCDVNERTYPLTFRGN